MVCPPISLLTIPLLCGCYCSVHINSGSPLTAQGHWKTRAREFPTNGPSASVWRPQAWNSSTPCSVIVSIIKMSFYPTTEASPTWSTTQEQQRLHQRSYILIFQLCGKTGSYLLQLPNPSKWNKILTCAHFWFVYIAHFIAFASVVYRYVTPTRI